MDFIENSDEPSIIEYRTNYRKELNQIHERIKNLRN